MKGLLFNQKASLGARVFALRHAGVKLNKPSRKNHVARAELAKKSLFVLVLYVVVVAAFGGSAREDVVQLSALRVLIALVCIPLLYWLSREGLRDLRAPFFMLLAFSVWLFLQLVPLPPEIWTALPYRSAIAEIDALTGSAGLWRPISMSPDRGWNAFAGLIVPASALILAAALRFRSQMYLQALVGLGFVNSALALMQLLSGSPALYFYRVTNLDGGVGLFANENHSAVFSALCLLLIAYLGASGQRNGMHAAQKFALLMIYVVTLLAALSSGSQAGVMLAVLAMIATSLMFGLQRIRKTSSKGRSGASKSALQSQGARLVGLLPYIIPVFLVGVLVAFIAFGDKLSLTNFIEEDPLGERRTILIPLLSEMVSQFWLLGSGFGSFSAVFAIFEPTEMMGPSYLNQAHNDWFQFAIEGGLPAIVVFASLLLWIGWKFLQVVRLEGLFSNFALLWAFAMIVLASASVIDYPLRTPIFQVASVWLLVSLALRSREYGKG
jgi:hypothetical protein